MLGTLTLDQARRELGATKRRRPHGSPRPRRRPACSCHTDPSGQATERSARTLVWGVATVKPRAAMPVRGPGSSPHRGSAEPHVDILCLVGRLLVGRTLQRQRDRVKRSASCILSRAGGSNDAQSRPPGRPRRHVDRGHTRLGLWPSRLPWPSVPEGTWTQRSGDAVARRAARQVRGEVHRGPARARSRRPPKGRSGRPAGGRLHTAAHHCPPEGFPLGRWRSSWFDRRPPDPDDLNDVYRGRTTRARRPPRPGETMSVRFTPPAPLTLPDAAARLSIPTVRLAQRVMEGPGGHGSWAVRRASDSP